MQTPTIPGYDGLTPLPQGGMSAVFKARQRSLDRQVVVKTLPRALAADSADIAQFLEEAKITAQLKHPNIVQVYDFGQAADGTYYFVMEFVSGYSVADWIRRKGRLTTDDALLCAQCVAEALRFAWDTAGVVHCDIKPDNVMIDGDGTVKVADLGLARSTRTVMDSSKSSTGLIIGTPFYIAPEQSRGDRDLDCRTDMYGLGAMLYHCLTGRMPFEGAPPVEVMDRQITDQIPDLLEVDPAASAVMACLVEKLMAKKPGHRPADWPEVIRDLKRARSNRMPEGPLLPLGASTLRRCPAREAWLRERASVPERTASEPRPRRVRRLTAAGLALALAGAAGLLALRFRPAPVSEPEPEPAGPVLPPPTSGDELIRQQVDLAVHWARAHPDRYDEALRRLERLADEVLHSPYAAAVQAEIDRVREARRIAVEAVVSRLEGRAQLLAARQQWGAAADVMESYDGPFAAETETARRVAAREWRAQDATHQDALQRREQARLREQECQAQWQRLLQTVAQALSDGDAAAALDAVRGAAIVSESASTRGPAHRLEAALREAARLDERLLDSFRAQKGEEHTVELNQGPERLAIRDVQDDAVLVEKIIMVSAGRLGQSKIVRLSDLALSEKQARIGMEPAPESALLRGLLAVREGAWASAETQWRQVGTPLAEPLVARLNERSRAEAELRAREDLIFLLRAARVEDAESVPPGDACLAAIQRAQYPARMAQLLNRAAADYLDRHGRTVLAGAYAPVLNALATVKPAPDAGAGAARPDPAHVQGLRAQVAAANPGLDDAGLVITTDLGGRIVGVEITSASLRDLTPLAGLPHLQTVVCSGLGPGLPAQALLSDLAPLRNAPLLAVTLRHTRVSDLSPLAGKPLERLTVSHARVRDLSPLRGMPLKELVLERLPVRDVTPLAGLPIESLTLSWTEVEDLSPLAGLPLKLLNIAGTPVRSLAPLQGMSLRSLAVNDTRVRDLTPVQDAPIEELWIGFNLDNPVTDAQRAIAAVARRLPRLVKVNGRERIRPWAGKP